MNLRLGCSQRDRLFQLLFRSSKILDCREHQAEIVMGIVVVGVERDGRLQMGTGGGELAAFIFEDAAQIQKIKIVGTGGEQLARQRARQHEVAIKRK